MSNEYEDALFTAMQAVKAAGIIVFREERESDARKLAAAASGIEDLLVKLQSAKGQNR